MSSKQKTIRTEPDLDTFLKQQSAAQKVGPASRSVPEDTLRLAKNTKDAQRPQPANSSERNNVDVEESLGSVKKIKSEPAFVGAQAERNQERDSLNLAQANRIDRSYQEAKESGAKRVQQARQATHGKIQHSGNNGDDATGGSKLVRT